MRQRATSTGSTSVALAATTLVGTALVAVALVIGAVALAACSNEPTRAGVTAPGAPVRVGEERLAGRYVAVATVEHPADPAAYTQGLEVVGDLILESSGGYGRSFLRLSELATAVPVLDRALPPELFGEGVTVVGDVAIQLTWRAGRALVWSLDDLVVVDEHAYEGEGWGLCHDGERLVMSDGTSTLTIRDPDTFEVTGMVEVRDERGRRVDRLNELECVGEQVLANVYERDEIVAIDAVAGMVEAVIDASQLRPAELPDDRHHVLNGIAFDPATGALLLTGKFWPTIFEVELEPA